MSTGRVESRAVAVALTTSGSGRAAGAAGAAGFVPERYGGSPAGIVGATGVGGGPSGPMGAGSGGREPSGSESGGGCGMTGSGFVGPLTGRG